MLESLSYNIWQHLHTIITELEYMPSAFRLILQNTSFKHDIFQPLHIG